MFLCPSRITKTKLYRSQLHGITLHGSKPNHPPLNLHSSVSTPYLTYIKIARLHLKCSMLPERKCRSAMVELPICICELGIGLSNEIWHSVFQMGSPTAPNLRSLPGSLSCQQATPKVIQCSHGQVLQSDESGWFKSPTEHVSAACRHAPNQRLESAFVYYIRSRHQDAKTLFEC